MQVKIERLGDEGTPVVIIDGAHPNPQQLVDFAQSSQWLRENPNYPGVRAQVPASYLDEVVQLCAESLQQAFGIDVRHGLSSDAIHNAFCCFSMVTRPPDSLRRIQSLPHFDAVTGKQLAMLHYLCDEPFRGTRFFKHLESGFENILEDRVPTYQAQAKKLVEAVQPGYASHCGTWYEAIGEVEAKFNRVAFYPASLLHSGIVDSSHTLSDNARTGRLTTTGFIDTNDRLCW